MALLVNFVAPGLSATVRVHMPTVTGGEHSTQGGFYLATLFFAQWIAFLVLTRWHGWRFRFAPVVAAYGLLLMGAAVCGFSGGTFVFGVGCVLIGFGLGMSASLSLYYSVAAATNRGQRGGIHEGVLSTGASVIPYLGGLMATTPLAAVVAWPAGIPHLTAGVLVLAAFVFAVRFYARSRSSFATPESGG